MALVLHQGDLPADVDFGPSVAVDTETTGLSLLRDRLCLVQMSDADGNVHIVQLPKDGMAAPNLRRLMTETSVVKLFHFARFDMAMMYRWLDVMPGPVFCTKIASKLVRTYTDKHNLKELCRELLGVDLSKQQQSSDWAAADLSDKQLEYAASDVLHLHALKAVLDAMLAREDRTALAEASFAYLPTRVLLDLGGWRDEDIFHH